MFDSIQFKKVETLDEVWYGKINEQYFVVEGTAFEDKKALLLKSNYHTESLMGSILDFVEEYKRNNDDLILSYQIDANGLKIFFEWKENTYYIDIFISELSKKLFELNIKSVCVHCNSEEELSFYSHNRGVSLLCNHCGETLSKELENSQNQPNNYLAGFAGSLIGALIGSVLWIVLGQLGWVASIAGYAIAFCAIQGYRKLGGKMNKTGVIINIITIIVAFFFAYFAGLGIEIYREWHLSFSQYFNSLGILFKDSEFILSFVKEIGLGAVFLFLGVRSTIKNSFGIAKASYEFSIEKLEL